MTSLALEMQCVGDTPHCKKNVRIVGITTIFGAKMDLLIVLTKGINMIFGAKLDLLL
jgi:hypothetical protein